MNTNYRSHLVTSKGLNVPHDSMFLTHAFLSSATTIAVYKCRQRECLVRQVSLFTFSSSDVKGLGISNPMFAENDEEGEHVDQDEEVKEDAEEEEQNGQEKQEEMNKEEKKGEEEEKLIDFDEDVDGQEEKTVEEPLPEEPAMRSLADRIRMFRGGDAYQSEKEKRPPPKIKDKMKMFEASETSPPSIPPPTVQDPPPPTAPPVPKSDPPSAPQPPQSDPPTAPPLPQGDTPAVQPPKQGGQMSVEAWDKELQGILDKMN